MSLNVYGVFLSEPPSRVKSAPLGSLSMRRSPTVAGVGPGFLERKRITQRSIAAAPAAQTHRGTFATNLLVLARRIELAVPALGNTALSLGATSSAVVSAAGSIGPVPTVGTIGET